MKKYLLPIIFVLTLSFSGIASAEVSSSTKNKINDLKQKVVDIKVKAAEDKAKMKAQIASTTTSIKNIRQELKSAAEVRIGKKLDAQKTKVADVFEKAIQNEKDLITRIQSRMAKMTLGNINVSSSTSLLNAAKTKLGLAETELANLENLLTQNIPTATTTASINNARKTALKNINLQSEKTKAAIKTAHASIIDVVNSLKKGLNTEKDTHSTSTPTSRTFSTSTNN